VIPNRRIVGEILHNYGKVRQLALEVGVAYDTDLGAAIRTIEEVLRRNPRVLQEPAPVIGVSRLGESAVAIGVNPWVGVPDYVAAGAEINQAILESFRARNIMIPFPQREVRMLAAAA
jgi:small conductance mechanosensitive channel